MYLKGINVQKKYKSEYRAWWNAKQRCFNKNHFMYKDYGNRGIIMCDKWKYSFLSFLKDIGIKPNKNLTLDRIDNNRGYEVDNCRWVSRKIQANNRRKRLNYEQVKKIINVLGIEKTVGEWNKYFGYKSNTLYLLARKKKLTLKDVIINKLDKISN